MTPISMVEWSVAGVKITQVSCGGEHVAAVAGTFTLSLPLFLPTHPPFHAVYLRVFGLHYVINSLF